MTNEQAKTFNRYFGTQNKKDAETLARILNTPSVEPQKTMLDYCTENPQNCEYYTSKKGTQLVRITFETGTTKTYEVARLGTTALVEY